MAAKKKVSAKKKVAAKKTVSAKKKVPAKKKVSAKKKAPKPTPPLPPVDHDPARRFGEPNWGTEWSTPVGARIGRILDTLARSYPEPTTALTWQDPVHLLVATILSAQCTDERVNQVTPALFRRYPTAAALAAADPTELEAMIHSTGFFRAKARSIIGACEIIATRHGGAIPPSMEAMVELPGVARKTANVVLGTALGLATGVAVDTHVKRLAGRLALSSHTDTDKIEQDLMRVIPQERWIGFSHQLILHGRQVCQARKPRCGECPLAADCPSANIDPQ